MSDHRSEDDSLHPDDLPPYAPTPLDELRRLRYTVFPTLYTDEDSTVNDLLWQSVLEQRALRYLVAIGLGVFVTVLIATAVTLVVLA